MTTFNTSEKLYINIISIKKLSLVKNQLYHKINGEKENIDPITTAFVTALAIPMAKDVIKDGYEALKKALKNKFGEESDVVNAVEQLEKKPDSEGRKAILQEEIENAKIYNDPQMVKLAEELLKQIEPEESAAASKFKTEFQGEVKGAQIGDGNTQKNTFS